MRCLRTASASSTFSAGLSSGARAEAFRRSSSIPYAPGHPRPGDLPPRTRSSLRVVLSVLDQGESGYGNDEESAQR